VNYFGGWSGRLGLRLTMVALALLGCGKTACAQVSGPFVVDTSQAPDLRPWADRAVAVWTKAYPLICAELASPGYQPPALIRVRIDSHYDGIAEYSFSGITVSAKFIRSDPEDAVAAVIHEIAHAVQGYGIHIVPGWLVEGIADYVRFFRWSQGQLGRINPDRSHYYGSYRVTASFLNYLVIHYDPDIVRKLNQICREGRYRDAVFQQLTGKSVQALGAEWRMTLPRTAEDFDEGQGDEEDSEISLWRWLLYGALGGAVGLGIALAARGMRKHYRARMNADGR
jgi:hypothetical protein